MKIADRLFNLPSFIEQYKSILRLSVCKSIENLIWEIPEEELITKINWNNLLGISSVLCQSSKPDHLKASLRIAQTCLELSNKSNFEQKAASIYILEKLSNNRAYELAIKKGLIESGLLKTIPLKLKFEINKEKFKNSIEVNNKILTLNKFQKEVFDKAEIMDALSISAPTSSGKSFILYQLIAKRIEHIKNLIYVVPTRALVDQVEDDINKILCNYEFKDFSVSSIPRRTEAKHNIYVLTQERLHRLYTDNPTFICDIIIIDEAHKIEEGYRGILLENKIENIIKKNPNIEIYFASPFTSNPEILLNLCHNILKKDTVNTEFIAVNQNLIYVSHEKGQPLTWNLDLITNNNKIRLGKVKLKQSQRPTTESKKMGFLANVLGSSNGGNIIYANGPAEAEDYARIISTIKEQKYNNNLNDLIKIVKKEIHKDYILSNILSKRISIHYGNLPVNLRREIEYLFKNNEIEYLICTSTLLEGVNLPAKNIFIRNPKRGKQTPLNENDFWNLAGRAGRWGKEFSGNIFCIEPEKWILKPEPSHKRQIISMAIEGMSQKNQKELIEYIRDINAQKKRNLYFEFASNYFYSKYKKGELEDTSFYNKIKEALLLYEEFITLPLEIIERNPGLSPETQQHLFNYFQSYEKPLEELIPAYPEDSESWKSYIKLIQRISKIIGDSNPKRAPYHSTLVLKWMKGYPLSILIQDSIDYYQNNNKNFKIDSVCREVMAEIEDFVRFRFVKDTNCYIDILKYFFNLKEKNELINLIPDLGMWLEFGVSEETQISLLSLGFCRQTTIEISKLIPNSNFSKQQCIDWLSEFDEENNNLNSLIIAEIVKIKFRYDITKSTSQ